MDKVRAKQARWERNLISVSIPVDKVRAQEILGEVNDPVEGVSIPVDKVRARITIVSRIVPAQKVSIPVDKVRARVASRG